MNNPYQAPQSDIVIDNIAPLQRHFAWKIFAWVLLVLEILGDLETFIFSDETITLLNILGFPVYIITIVGLFAFAYSKKILNQLFWKLFFPILIVMDVFSIMQESMPLLQGDRMQVIISIAVMAVIALPIVALQYYAMFQYAFVNSELWQNR